MGMAKYMNQAPPSGHCVSFVSVRTCVCVCVRLSVFKKGKNLQWKEQKDNVKLYPDCLVRGWRSHGVPMMHTLGLAHSAPSFVLFCFVFSEETAVFIYLTSF